MNYVKLFTCMAFVLFLCTGCEEKTQKEETVVSEKKASSTNYPIVLTTTDETNISVTKIDKGYIFSNAKDKAVLLNFFTTWCPPCKAEIPHLNNLQKNYKNNLSIISVLIEDKDLDAIKDFIKENEINYTITHGKENFVLAKAIGDVQAIPFMILYDKNGKYANHYVGAVPEEMIDVDIERAIK